jgi:hypothetical protein
MGFSSAMLLMALFFMSSIKLILPPSNPEQEAERASLYSSPAIFV